MKAKPVKGLDPQLSVARNAARIVRTRLDELCSFDPAVRDPAAVRQLHDMRIAAKRLRYVLEITGHTLGEAGVQGEGAARDLQEVLGEIHDCDTLLPRIEAMRAALGSQDASALAELAEGDPERVPGLVERAPNAVSHRGLATLAAAVQARRELLYGRFLERWDALLADGFRERLTEATAAARAG